MQRHASRGERGGHGMDHLNSPPVACNRRVWIPAAKQHPQGPGHPGDRRGAASETGMTADASRRRHCRRKRSGATSGNLAGVQQPAGEPDDYRLRAVCDGHTLVAHGRPIIQGQVPGSRLSPAEGSSWLVVGRKTSRSRDVALHTCHWMSPGQAWQWPVAVLMPRSSRPLSSPPH